MTLSQKVWEALDTVEDPCSAQLGRPMSLVTMGLVDSVRVSDDEVGIQLILTDPTCVFFFKFLDEIRDRVEPLAGSRVVNVAMAEDVLWSPDRIQAD